MEAACFAAQDAISTMATKLHTQFVVELRDLGVHAWLEEAGNRPWDFVPSLGHLSLLAACALGHAVADTAFNVRHPDGTQLYFCGVPSEVIARDARVA
eukprot:5715549-Prymnesium_polylepis.1